jgi:hypothetical protein
MPFYRRASGRVALNNPASVASNWTPSDATTEFWFDADDAGTFTTEVGGEALAWDDKSGNARDLDVPFVNGVFPTAATQNGKNGMLCDFASSGKGFATTSAFTLSQPFTLYVAWKNKNAQPNGFASVWDGDNDAAGTRAIFFARRSDAGDDPHVYAGSLVAVGADIANNTAYYYTIVFDGASSAAWRNGVAIGTINPGTAGITDGMTIGHAGTDPLDGYYLEIFCIANAGTERTDAEAYLAAKWAI